MISLQGWVRHEILQFYLDFKATIESDKIMLEGYGFHPGVSERTAAHNLKTYHDLCLDLNGRNFVYAHLQADSSTEESSTPKVSFQTYHDFLLTNLLS